MRAGALIALLVVAACEPATGTWPVDGGADVPDASRDGMVIDPCDDCQTICEGGAICFGGMAWDQELGTVPCCPDGQHAPDPWCSTRHYQCSQDRCDEHGIDARYQLCVAQQNRTEDCLAGDCEILRLLCVVEGAAKMVGSPCHADDDCRPAAAGVARLRCEKDACVEDARPAPFPDYGSSCGLPDDFMPDFTGESTARAGMCLIGCQIARAPGGCLRQACTMPCVFDEDCAAGSICLCSDHGDFGSYCAPASDRDTPEGRAAGLAACP